MQQTRGCQGNSYTVKEKGQNQILYCFAVAVPADFKGCQERGEFVTGYIV